MPVEREKVIEIIRKKDEYAFALFKRKCLKGYYDRQVEEGFIKLEPPRQHTSEELGWIIQCLLDILF